MMLRTIVAKRIKNQVMEVKNNGMIVDFVAQWADGACVSAELLIFYSL
jgi:hypothetical protein